MGAHLYFRLIRMLGKFGIIKEVHFNTLKDVYGTRNGYSVSWCTKTTRIQQRH